MFNGLKKFFSDALTEPTYVPRNTTVAGQNNNNNNQGPQQQNNRPPIKQPNRKIPEESKLID